MAKTIKWGSGPDMINEAAALIAKATAGLARVNVTEVADFLLKPIIVSVEQQLKQQAQGNVFVIEVPFAKPWHNFVAQSLRSQKLSDGRPVLEALSVDKGKETSNIVDLYPTLATVAGNAEAAQQIRQILADVQSLVQMALLQNRNIYLVVQRRESLPEELEFFSPKVLSLPRFTPELFNSACHAFFDGLQVAVSVGAGDRAWISHVEPTDFLINTSVTDEKIASSIRSTVEHRLRQLASGLSPAPLEKFNGIDAIIGWAGELKAAIDNTDPEAGWSGVVHGALFESRDALYVREIAKAMADHCGFAFVSASILDLLQGRDVIRALFDRAWTHAPAVLFIENFEELTDTRQFVGRTQEQQGLGAIRNALLKQIENFRPSEPVVIIGSTVAHRHLDAEYRLPGRLERVFVVPKPSQKAMAALFKEALEDHLHDISDDAFVKLGQFASAMGDIRLIKMYVAHAARQARKEKRQISFEDLRDAILRGTAEGGDDVEHTALMREQVAYHEGGHAAMGILNDGGKQIPEYATIVPSADAGGFVLFSLDDRQKLRTYQDCLNDLRRSLASRAVEEIKYGITAVSTGAGGGRGSDLHSASVNAMAIFAVYGFSPDPNDPSQSGKCLLVDPGEHPLDPKDWARDPVISAHARKLLNDVYLETRSTLQEHWGLVERIALRLMSDDVLDSAALDAIYSDYEKSRSVA
jgi:hypothetical protein